MTEARTELKVRIGGMHCASCVSKVERSLQSVPGVSNVQIQLLSGTGAVSVEGEADWDRLSASLKDGGYSIEPLSPLADSTTQQATADWESSFLPAGMSIALGSLLMGLMHRIPHSWFYWLGAGVATFVQLAWGRPFLAGMGRWLRGRGASMETLVGIGTTAALGLSLTSPHHPYFEVGVFLVGFVRLGKWLEARAKTRTGTAIRRLLSLSPPTALRVLANDTTEEVPASALQTGDHVRVLAGARIPADGEVLSGHSSVDESWLTGESVPAEKTPGSKVLAGSQNGLGMLEFTVRAAAGKSLLSQVIDRVERAQMSRAPIQRVADQVAAVFVPTVLVISALTLAVWLMLGGGLPQALLHAVSVLVIACPCALGLATPAALVVGLGRASEAGILFKSGAALETLARARTYVFDKTGTLTLGHPELAAIEALNTSRSENHWLELAASAELGSEHPLARAMIQAATLRGLNPRSPARFESLPGQGLRASVEGQFVLIGTPRFLAEQGVALPAPALQWMDHQAGLGASCVILAHDFTPAALFAFRDPPRADSASLIRWLKNEGLSPMLLSGDRTPAAHAMGTELGFEASAIEAEVLPHQKEARIAILAQSAGPVVMAGDGINDAPALARASVSVSLLGASETALDSAQVILMSGRISDLQKAIEISRATLRTIRQNLAASAIYNVVGIPLAAGMLEHWGISMTPAWAGAAMALSSVSVVTNSLRLKRA
jgi:Cu+-exporting ATPase